MTIADPTAPRTAPAPAAPAAPAPPMPAPAVRGSIVIPAHDEEAVILRTLDGLRPLLEQRLVEVVVACNGCSDRTAALAASVAGVTVLQTPKPLKTAAMNAADGAATHWPRLYLDADIAITADAALAVLDSVSCGEAMAARPEYRYVMGSASAPVRAYYRARDRLPITRGGLWGAGAFALGPEGHARFGEFPMVIADDVFVDRHFSASEKRIVPTNPVPVRVPQRVRNLMAVLRRQARGAGQPAIRTTTSTTPSTVRQLLASVRGPRSAADAMVYALLSIAARRPSSRRRASTVWERDDSTRVATPAAARMRVATPTTAATPTTVAEPVRDDISPRRAPVTPMFAGMDDAAEVVAVVVTYESRSCIDALIDSLRVEAAERAIRVVVADNASGDGTLEHVRSRHPDAISFGTGANLGYAAAINRCAPMVGDARAVLVLNPDAVVEPGCVQALLARLDSSGAGAVVPGIREADGRTARSIRREPSLLGTLGDSLFGGRLRGRPGWLSETVFDARAYATAHPIDWATGAAVLFDAGLAQRVGPWDERYFLFSEETDYFRRLREAGGTVWFEPRAVVTHAEGGSGRSPALNALSAVNRIRYARKFRSRTYAAAFRSIAVLAEVLRVGRPQSAGALAVVLNANRWSEVPHAPEPAPAPDEQPVAGVSFGYLVPEFPGQTHTFFWREIEALRRLGGRPRIISTRKPRHARGTHDWAERATAEARYLFPGSPISLVGAVWLLLSTAVQARLGPVLRESARAHAEFGVSRSRLLGLVITGAELARLARREGLRHVHVHSCADSAWVALFANLLTGVHYSLTAHGPLRDYGDGQAAKWARASFGFAITNRLRDEITAELDGALPAEFAVAPMGIDPARFSRTTPYRPAIPGSTARIFSCGRLNPSKGHDDLIRAAALLVAGGRDVELVIAGDDDSDSGHRNRLERLIEASGLSGRVRLLGSVPEAGVRAELERADVFALASHDEPLGVATMEAMAMGVPVVVTGGGGVTELVEDGVTGLLATAHAPWMIAADIARLLDRPDLATRLGAAGHDRVTRSFTSASSAATLLRHVEMSDRKAAADGRGGP
ncbi:exopolysaccharide biosynthesis GT4 family glycosyltransferase EpsE [Agromyces allii]|uniref:D-inositol 3-phosphate glycosyltransferase n=1 Tax=Agromyces allii TaxID=393607 RepID=A0ABP5C1Z6_9MICO|nr:exopolysaccharide biosynthesis GT4 family glycosyltransferase EpsE [Agromyces allii]